MSNVHILNYLTMHYSQNSLYKKDEQELPVQNYEVLFIKFFYSTSGLM